MLNFNATEINIYVHLRQWGTATPQQAPSRLSQQFFGAPCWHSVCTVILWPTFPQNMSLRQYPTTRWSTNVYKAENSRTKEPFCKGPVSLCHPQSSESVQVSANERRDEWVWYATFSLSELKFKRQNKQKERCVICSRQDSRGKWKLFAGWGGCGVCWGRYNTELMTSHWEICL